MPRREQPLEPGDDPLLRFAAGLRQLREQAGKPTYRQLSARAHYSAAALSEAAGGRKLPTLAVALAYVRACDGDPELWEQRWRKVSAEITVTPETIVENGEEPPYVGLAAFQPGDAERFFGRESLVTELVRRVGERRFFAVFGASGSGKSSILRAGLATRFPSHEVVILTPGPHPIEECAVQLSSVIKESAAVLRAELATDPRSLHLRVRQADVDLLLIVDQFEELFTLCQDEAERRWLVDALTLAASAETSRTRVVLGVRADFYGHCSQHPALVEAIRDAQLLVGPMTADELRQAITEPAVRAGCRVEIALVARLVSDATGQPAVLPMVSHALLETWRRRRGATLTLAGYESAGGIQHALARTAEDIYATLDPHHQDVAKRIFLRLIALGDGTEDTKRRIARHELDADTPAVLDRLAAARLITLDRDTVELTHEALIRHWPRLRTWLTEDRDGQRIHHDLADATNIWESLGRDPGALYRGTRLARAEDWVTSRDAMLSQREQEFLHTSLSIRDAERVAGQRRTRRLRQLVALLVVLLLVAVATTAFAIRAQRSTAQQRTVAVAQKVLREAASMRAANPALALQLAVAAYRLDPTKAARDTLLELLATPYATKLADHPSSVFGVAVSSDGRIAAFAFLGASTGVKIRDISDPLRPRDLADLPATASAVAFSPTAPILALASHSGESALWDLTDPRNPRRLAGFASGVGPGIGASVSFRADGQVLAIAGSDRTVRLWDISRPEKRTLLATVPPGPEAGRNPGIGASVDFSPDGHTLVATARDPTARLWDVTNPREPRPLGALTGHTESVLAVRFSPNGNVLVTASHDRTARLWRVADPRNPELLAQLTGHSGAISSVAFSRDGSTLATAGEDRTTRLWNVADPLRPSDLTTLAGHTDTVYSVAFSMDGRALITGSGDQTALLTDISQLAFARHADAITDIAFTPRGNLVATASADQTVQLWDFSDWNRPRKVATLRADTEPLSLSFSSDSQLLAVVSDAGIHIWSVREPTTPQAAASIPTAGFNRAAFGPSDRILAVSSFLKRKTELLDLSDPNNPRMVGSVPESYGAFSPDGRLLTTTHKDGVLRLWDVSDPAEPQALSYLAGSMELVAFSPSGRLVATAELSETVMHLWDVTDARHPRQLTEIPLGTTAAVAAFGPDGRLATNGPDKTARIWNLADPGHPVEEATLRGHEAEVSALAFVGGGSRILTGDKGHVVGLWETDVERVVARVCDVAYPRIAQGEWERYFPGFAYRPPCG